MSQMTPTPSVVAVQEPSSAATTAWNEWYTTLLIVYIFGLVCSIASLSVAENFDTLNDIFQWPFVGLRNTRFALSPQVTYSLLALLWLPRLVVFMVYFFGYCLYHLGRWLVGKDVPALGTTIPRMGQPLSGQEDSTMQSRQGDAAEPLSRRRDPS
ncbi:hypothetical protein J7T55_008013 [Diaporthe amygdali]|uniref:uncharacterized protein n=1 Tax=Phomopsis amygdali TaxID=1214568 RepID=UPI0022FEE541|nr:uncharacterized protein J7T55_008013 [Diaporthe amygdali]KAJ0114178.1 hypothetical protein J7T55_008013 [Diaporthe amygdali]